MTQKPPRIKLTPRDLSVLKWIGEQYAARLDQLQRLLGAQAGSGAQTPGMLSESSTRVWITRMRQVGAIAYANLFFEGPGYVWLTTYGLALAGLNFQPLTPKASTLHHIYWCNQARLFVSQRRPSDTWRSERYLRQDHAQATTSTSRSHRVDDVPDALVMSSEGRNIAIELELTAKQQVRLNGLVRRRAAMYHTTWYFCSNEVQAIVSNARAQLEPEVQKHLVIYNIDILKE